MKNLLTAVLSVLCLGLFSCQKEVDDIFKSAGGNGNASGLLVKTVAVTGTDTLTTVYGYDNQKRLETITMDGLSNGIQMHTYKKFIRDASTRISQILQVVDQNGMSTDTSIQVVHYPSAAMEFDYTVNTLSVFGFSTTDSTVYAYSGSKMTSMTSNLFSPLLGSSSSIVTKTDFTYDASGNVVTIKIASDGGAGGPLSPVVNETFTYGPVINGTWVSSNGAQNLLLYGTPGTGTNAFTKAQIDDLSTPPTATQTLTATYTLGSGNKPTASVLTSTSGQVTKYSFYYQ